MSSQNDLNAKGKNPIAEQCRLPEEACISHFATTMIFQRYEIAGYLASHQVVALTHVQPMHDGRAGSPMDMAGVASCCGCGTKSGG